MNVGIETMYKQCLVEYEDGTESVIWIESKYAKINKLIYDKDLQKRCTVSEVYNDSEITKHEMTQMQHMNETFMNHDGSYK